MQVTMHLRVDATSFFDVLKQSILADMQEARGKKAKASNVHTGYSYKRYLKGKRDPEHAATLRITSWDPPHTYASTVSNAGGVITMSYEVVPCEGGGIDVTYTETFEGASASQNVFQRAIGFLKQLPAKSRIKNTLQDIEGQILAEQYDEEDETGI